MPDPTILVTGATDGIGRLTALRLAETGATLLLHGRTSGRVDAVVTEARETAGDERVHGVVADFAALAAVRDMAARITAAHPRLDVLINNAGVGLGGRSGVPRELSRDGHELRFQVNYLAPILLTRRLLPSLVAAAPARIVNVASLGQAAIDFDDVMLERGFDGFRAYRQSKLALVMATFDLAAELAGSGVTVNALHPGSLLDTKVVREAFGEARGKPEEGAAAEVALATAADFDGVSGRFFDQTVEARALDQAYDDEARRRLRDITDRLIGEG